jgi:Sec-independent protein translocase protein TatA
MCGEILIILLVALIVLGPEEFPATIKKIIKFCRTIYVELTKSLS